MAASSWVLALAERTEGFWTTVKRLVFRSHRPLQIDFFDPDGSLRLSFRRSFFFFFSDLSVESHEGTPLGSVHRRFGILHKKYDLLDASGRCFARIETPIWRLWTFPLFRGDGQRVGEISKKWSGLLREAFSDADTFQVNFGAAAFGEVERAVILAAAISIDFDFFEDNQPKRGLLKE